MKEKHFKLIMELIFIFIIPLVILCINCNYQNTIAYDNNGNYQATEKHIEFTPPFTYTKSTTINTETWIENNSYSTLQLDDIIKIYYDDMYDLGHNYYGIILLEDKYIEGLSYDDDTNYLFYYEDGINSNNYYQISSKTNEYIILTIEQDFIDRLGLEPDAFFKAKYYLKEGSTETITTNTIWGNLKDLIVDNLQIQDNQIVDIIITYTILWFIHFVIWHFFYLFFDGLVHLFIEWKKRSD